MRRSVWRAVAVAALACCGWTTNAAAQVRPAPDRVVGPDFFGKPLVVKTLTANDMGALAAAAHAPIGFEAAVGGEPHPLTINASGKPLRAVLDAIVAADDRYEWRDEGGVAVLRPTTAWTDRSNPLHRSVDAIRFEDVGVSEALQIAVALFGQDLHPSNRTDLGDARRFDLDVPPGSVFEALNAIVRSHGSLAWSVEPWPPTPTAPGTVLSPYMASLADGSTGRSIGIGVHLDREPRVPHQVERWGRPQPSPGGPVLERVVGKRANGDALVLHSIYEVPELAFAARAPMGVELLAPNERRVSSKGVQVTGLSLRDALTALMALDPRYEWQELDGVIVVRPLFAWTQPEHPLSRATGPVQLAKATVADAVSYLQTLLEPGVPYIPERDHGVEVQRISLSVAGGAQVLPLLNTIARSFGDLCWIYEELNDEDAAFFGGRRRQITLRSGAGEGRGFAFR